MKITHIECSNPNWIENARFQEVTSELGLLWVEFTHGTVEISCSEVTPEGIRFLLTEDSGENATLCVEAEERLGLLATGFTGCGLVLLLRNLQGPLGPLGVEIPVKWCPHLMG